MEDILILSWKDIIITNDQLYIDPGIAMYAQFGFDVDTCSNGYISNVVINNTYEGINVSSSTAIKCQNVIINGVSFGITSDGTWTNSSSSCIGLVLESNMITNASTTTGPGVTGELIGGFTGEFSPDNWTQIYSLDPTGPGQIGGNIEFTEAFAQIDGITGGLGSGYPDGVQLCISPSIDTVITFDWAYTSYDPISPFFNPFGYSLNSNFIPLTSNNIYPTVPINESGLGVIIVPA